MGAPSTRTYGKAFRTVSTALTAAVLASCVTIAVPQKPSPAPIEPALAASASQGNPMAELSLGWRKLARARSQADRDAAVALITSAAQANLAMAQGKLGLLYLDGYGVPQDTPLALQWIRRAANRGAPAAQLQLAGIYAAGAIVPADKAQAYYWYSIAAKPVHSDVTIFNIKQVRSFARKRAQTLADSLTPTEQASVARQVAAWAPKSSVPYSGRVTMGGF
jgi:hypothetical protein